MRRTDSTSTGAGLPSRLVALFKARLPAAGDERGSLPMVLIVMLVGLSLSAVLLTIMLAQSRVTVYTDTHMRSLSAAQAGVNVMVGKIREATSNGAGDPSRLPCAPATSPVTGVADSQSLMSYRVSVNYYIVDPVQDAAAIPMACVPGLGTFYRTSLMDIVVPRYAQITSTGLDSSRPASSSGASARRTVVTTYVVKTTNSNVAGGQLRVYPVSTDTGSLQLCMDAGSTNPAEGVVVTMQACSTTSPVAAQQEFSYRDDLTLQLNTSITSQFSNGLCLATAGPGEPKIGDVVYLTACNALGSPPYNQQWSFNDSGAFEASNPGTASSGNLSGRCMSVASRTIGRTVVIDRCDGDVSSPTQAWEPTPSVGDGAAAAPQLVNFQQFGRCADVTGQNVAANHLIAYPCKQNPLASAVRWNQKFEFDPSTGWLFTITPDNTKYCMFSPRTEGGWVRMTQCLNPGWVNGVDASQLLWDSKGSAATTPYSQRYTFVDSSSDQARCLSIAPTSDAAPWDYIVVATCDGSTAQKWNADANLTTTTLQNTQER
jgi:hypothetical protein